MLEWPEGESGGQVCVYEKSWCRVNCGNGVDSVIAGNRAE